MRLAEARCGCGADDACCRGGRDQSRSVLLVGRAVAGTSTVRRLVERIDDDMIVSVERAFHVIEYLADLVDGASLADLARHLDVNKAIALRILATLEAVGVVWRDDRVQRYNLTFRISNLGLRQLQKSRLLDQCAAGLRSLADQTGELVRLAIVEVNDSINWVHAVAGTKRSLQIDPNYSLEIRLNAHAIAKAWLSTMSFDRALKLMRRQGIVALTKNSKTAVEALRADLKLAAKRRFATSYEESEMGVSAIAAPIVVTTLSGKHECVGAVSLAAPTNRMGPKAFEACAPLLIETVDRLGKIWPLEARTLRILQPRRRRAALRR
ncbi:MAG: IclR family transcriptional regulator [Alphaproteobacteria bacterium]|nr:IclR family transcriptional regulator [Alphaproteobacteria bacterium]